MDTYFLMGKDSQEEQIAKEIEDKCDEVREVWQKFLQKYAPGHQCYRDHGILIAIEFANEAPPEGWCKVGGCYNGYRPTKRKLPQAYKEFVNMPKMPTMDTFTQKIGSEEMVTMTGNRLRITNVSYKRVGDQFILICPINEKGECYKPKGEFEELSTLRYLELTKKEKAD